MPDVLIKLYRLPPRSQSTASVPGGLEVRTPLAPERPRLLEWIGDTFGRAGWVSECEVASARVPPSCSIALLDDELVGFFCFDVPFLGFAGPGGVAPAARRRGIFRALMTETFHAMRNAGYAYAVVGDANAATVHTALGFPGSSVIDDSTSGAYPQALL